MKTPAFLKAAVYRAAGYALPVLSSLRNEASQESIGVITAHGVYPTAEIEGVRIPASSLLLRDVEANLLNVKGYSFVSIEEAEAMIKGAIPSRKRCLVLTFDDSLKSHVEVIAPKLIEWGVPATFYISTEIIETQRPYWWLRLEYAISKIETTSVTVHLPGREQITISPAQKWELRRKLSVALFSSFKPLECEKIVESVESQVGVNWKEFKETSPYACTMSWNDVRKLDVMGFTVGSHTQSHPNLTLVDPQELHSELVDSKQVIEKHTGKPCRHLSYPHGKHSDAVCEAARRAGYATAVTTEFSHWNDKGNDLFRLQRFPFPKPAYKLPFILSGLRGSLATARS